MLDELEEIAFPTFRDRMRVRSVQKSHGLKYRRRSKPTSTIDADQSAQRRPVKMPPPVSDHPAFSGSGIQPYYRSAEQLALPLCDGAVLATTDLLLLMRDQSDPNFAVQFPIQSPQPAPRLLHARHNGGVKKRAKVIDRRTLEFVVHSIRINSRLAIRDELILVLTHYAALRPCEAAGMEVRNMLTSTGSIAPTIMVMGRTSKRGVTRELPMHPRIREAFQQFRRRFPDALYVSFKGCDPSQPLASNAVVQMLRRAYAIAGLIGCSAHSGRRSCLTIMARAANSVGASLRDVQLFAGHARLDTTASYLEPSENLHALVNIT